MALVLDVEVEVEASSVSGGGEGGGRGGALSLEDCRCPVCLEIFMEPVTLPCTHTFCKGCFLESVDKATLCCPMCRKRVSTWARVNSRTRTLVNQQLWSRIQTCFPLQCERRLAGREDEDEDEPGVSLCFPRVSLPGELRQEYQDQLTKLMEEKRVLDEEERRASEEYIQRLLAEEQQLQQEERRRREEDERLAKLLSSQLNPQVPQENPGPAAVTPAKRKEVGAGQIERFLCPVPPKTGPPACSSASSLMANKENLLLSQGRRPLPDLDYYGPQTRSEPELCPAPHRAPVQDRAHRSQLTGAEGPSSTKRKSSELETEEEIISKRSGCPLPPSSSFPPFPSSSPSPSSPFPPSSFPPSPSSSPPSPSPPLEVQAELLSRQQQEEADRRLALLLQKQLDEEEKPRAPDRRPGAADAYLLRQTSRRGEKVEAGASTSPGSSSRSSPGSSSRSSPASSRSSSGSSSRSSRKASKTPPPSSSSSGRGSKQTTLMEMFSSLSS